MDYVGQQVDPQTYNRFYDALGVPNAVAAMPSPHMGVTFAVSSSPATSAGVSRSCCWSTRR
jgi:hypothetical protein